MKTPKIPIFDDMPCDKAKHMLTGALGTLGFLHLCGWLHQLSDASVFPLWPVAWTCAAAMCVIGGLKEGLDAKTPGRTPSFADFAYTAAGALSVPLSLGSILI